MEIIVLSLKTEIFFEYAFYVYDPQKQHDTNAHTQTNTYKHTEREREGGGEDWEDIPFHWISRKFWELIKIFETQNDLQKVAVAMNH